MTDRNTPVTPDVPRRASTPAARVVPHGPAGRHAGSAPVPLPLPPASAQAGAASRHVQHQAMRALDDHGLRFRSW